MFKFGTRRSEVAVSQQKKQNGERCENNLQGAIQAKCANKHHGGEQSPHREICGHGRFVRSRTPSDFRKNNQHDQ
jgi:hypothetical protein